MLQHPATTGSWRPEVSQRCRRHERDAAVQPPGPRLVPAGGIGQSMRHIWSCPHGARSLSARWCRAPHPVNGARGEEHLLGRCSLQVAPFHGTSCSPSGYLCYSLLQAAEETCSPTV
ncbi:unnamed protein product [Urochloa humidicola]